MFDLHSVFLLRNWASRHLGLLLSYRQVPQCAVHYHQDSSRYKHYIDYGQKAECEIFHKNKPQARKRHSRPDEGKAGSCPGIYCSVTGSNRPLRCQDTLFACKLGAHLARRFRIKYCAMISKKISQARQHSPFRRGIHPGIFYEMIIFKEINGCSCFLYQ